MLVSPSHDEVLKNSTSMYLRSKIEKFVETTIDYFVFCRRLMTTQVETIDLVQRIFHSILSYLVRDFLWISRLVRFILIRHLSSSYFTSFSVSFARFLFKLCLRSRLTTFHSDQPISLRSELKTSIILYRMKRAGQTGWAGKFTRLAGSADSPDLPCKKYNKRKYPVSIVLHENQFLTCW